MDVKSILQSQETCGRFFEKQCSLLDGVLDQHPSKLYVALPIPIQVARFVPAVSPTLTFLHLQKVLQARAGTQPLPVFVRCLLVAASFTTTTHLNWVNKSGRLLEVNKQNTPQMVENHSCEQFIDLLNSATIYSN